MKERTAKEIELRDHLIDRVLAEVPIYQIERTQNQTSVAEQCKLQFSVCRR